MRYEELLRFLRDEVRATLEDPSRLERIFDPRARSTFLERAKFRARGKTGGAWIDELDGNLRHRRYESYEDYVQHQAAKRAILSLGDYDSRLREELRQRLADAGLKAGAAGLCLGARNGGEVQALIDLGLFAIGVDLNPDPDSGVVVRGDFNALQWSDDTVDVVYSNSFDHALNLADVGAEARRVLRPDGRLIIDFMSGVQEEYTGSGQLGVFGAFEATSWDRIDDAVRVVEGSGFETLNRKPIRFPWPGEMVELTPRHQ